jgi:hypothetical protein
VQTALLKKVHDGDRERFVERLARPDGRSRATILWQNRTPPAVRLRRGKASLSGEKTAVACLVIGNPPFHLLTAELTRRRQLAAAGAQPHSEKQEQLLLLFRGQRRGGGFDLSKRAHKHKLSTGSPLATRLDS